MARRNILVKQGATWRLVFRVEDDGVPRDLTGYSARLTARRQYGDSSTTLALDTSPGGGIVIEPAAGRVRMEASATDTGKLEAPRADVYDVELESPTGVVERVLEGVARITPEVSD